MNAPTTDGSTRSGRSRWAIRAHRGLTPLVMLGAASALVAACGATSSPTGSVAGTTTQTAAAASTPTPSAATPTPGTAAVVMEGMATVAGASEEVLTGANGWTLYYNTKDSATNATCTGTCITHWPPLLLPSGQPTSSSSLLGTLTTYSDANGMQVEYNGHPLYQYAGDTGAGQANGEGAGGVWYVVQPSLTAASPTASPSAAAVVPGY